MRHRYLQVMQPFAWAAALAAGAWFLLAPAGGAAGRADAHLAPVRVVVHARPDSLPGDHARFLSAARVAWTYLEREYQPQTGLVNSVTQYPYGTIWDVASILSATLSAHRLGLVTDEEYDRRMRLALTTLRGMRLFDGIAFNKTYSMRTGAISGRDERDRAGTQRGYGWSSTDLGRLLVVLHAVKRAEPRWAADVDAIVARLDFDRLVRDGYLWGLTVSRGGRTRQYVEGRIPYEQYAAAGFAAWGHPAERAARMEENALPVRVMEVPLLADRRGGDHLTSEPLVLWGLELGWTPEVRLLAERMLQVQEERYRRTGQVTVVSEDAIPLPPYYFYYYAVNLDGRWFSIAAPNQLGRMEGPRWVSAKAAYGWHALLPGEYTRLGIEAVERAADPARGWGSGVYEQTGRPTGGQNINTAAVILEAAHYRLTGRPLMETVPRAATPSSPSTSPPT